MTSVSHSFGEAQRLRQRGDVEDVGALHRLAGDDANWVVLDARQRADQAAAEALAPCKQRAGIHDRRQHLAHVVFGTRLGGHEARHPSGFRRDHRRDRGRHVGSVGHVDQGALDRLDRLLGVDDDMRAAARVVRERRVRAARRRSRPRRCGQTGSIYHAVGPFMFAAREGA
jgi:hypothetical protein